MAIFYGRTTARTTNGDTVVSSIVDTDGSTAFTPKFILFWTSGAASAGFTDGAYWSCGFTDGTRHACRGYYGNADNVTIQLIGRHSIGFELYSEARVVWLRRHLSKLPNSSDVSAEDIYATISAVGSGTFTLTWTISAPFTINTGSSSQAYTPPNVPTTEVVHFLCIGGDGVSARCDVFTAPSSAGAQSKAVTGVGFAPSGLITLNPLSTSASATGTGSDTTGWRLSGFGFVSNALVNEVCGGFGTGYYTGSTTNRYMYREAAWTERTMSRVSGYPRALLASVTSLDADGFTSYFSELASTFVSVRMPYVAFTGIPMWVGRIFAPAATGVQSYTDPNFRVKGCVFQGAGYTASASANQNPAPNPLRLGIGAATDNAANNMGAAFMGDGHGVNPTVSVRGLSTTKGYIAATPNATGSSTAIYSALEWSADTATGFDGNWTTVSGSAEEVFVAAFGEAGVEPPEEPPAVPTGTTTYTRRLRRFPLPFDQNLQVFIARLELLIQSGVGLSTGQGSDPHVMCRFSKDGGQTWGPELHMGMGATGEYSKRAYLNWRGRGRNLVCEVTFSDPVFVALLEAYVDVDKGLH